MLIAPARELLPHLVNGAEEMSANCAGAQPEVIGDLLEREIFVVTQAEDQLLLRRQPRFRARDRAAQLHGHRLALGIGTLVGGLVCELFRLIVIRAREEADELAAAEEVACAVDRDAREPRLELRPLFEFS